MSRPTVTPRNPATLPTSPGYSQITLTPTGTLVVIAGQVALDHHDDIVGAGDPSAQTSQVSHNLLAALHEAGAEPHKAVKLTTYVTDIAMLAAFCAVRHQFLDPNHPPASTRDSGAVTPSPEMGSRRLQSVECRMSPGR